MGSWYASLFETGRLCWVWLGLAAPGAGRGGGRAGTLSVHSIASAVGLCRIVDLGTRAACAWRPTSCSYSTHRSSLADRPSRCGSWPTSKHLAPRTKTEPAQDRR